MIWTPVLSGADADRARTFVAAAVRELATREVVDPSLGYGEAGIAILHGYRALVGEPDGAEQAFAILARVLDRLLARPQPSLFDGYAGVAFALHHLAAVLGDGEEALGDLDALIVEALAVDTWNREWELQTGLVGLGMYAIERGSNPMVQRVVHHLAARAEMCAEGITWRAYTKTHPLGYYDLGIAHGVAGVIGFLAEVCARPGAPTVACDLLVGAVQWLRTNERPDVTPVYPMVLAGGPTFDGILDGWCFGDPSTALVLVRAGQALDEPSWIAAGHALAIRAARRTNDELATISIDAALCHGTIGHAHIFHVLGTALGDAELLEAARRWYVRTLDRTVIAEVSGSGLQTGLAGIALGVLAGYTNVDPAWNRILVLR